MKNKFNQPTNTIGDFIKKQGLEVKDGSDRITKKESLKDIAEVRKIALEEMGYNESGEVNNASKVKNFDPINHKDYSHSGQYKPFERKHEELYAEKKYGKVDAFEEDKEFYKQDDEPISQEGEKKYIEDFLNEDSLYEFAYKKEEDEIGKKDFENEYISESWADKTKKMKEKKLKEEREYYEKSLEYSDFEKKEMIKALESWLNKKDGLFTDGTKMTTEQTLEMIKEFKDAFPEEFTKMISRKLITKDLGEFKWEKEDFKNQKRIVSYYPSKEKALIKYINNDIDFENLDRVFVTGSINKKGRAFKSQEGCLLVFCSAPLHYKGVQQEKRLEVKKKDKVEK